MLRILSCLPFLLVAPHLASAENLENMVSMVGTEPYDSFIPQDCIEPLPLGKLGDERCYTVDKDRVMEFDQGSVYLRYLDKVFGELYIGFGNDQRDVARIVSGETAWKFCFDSYIRWDEFGNAHPDPRAKRFVPPDTSS